MVLDQESVMMESNKFIRYYTSTIQGYGSCWIPTPEQSPESLKHHRNSWRINVDLYQIFSKVDQKPTKNRPECYKNYAKNLTRTYQKSITSDLQSHPASTTNLPNI